MQTRKISISTLVRARPLLRLIPHHQLVLLLSLSQITVLMLQPLRIRDNPVHRPNLHIRLSKQVSMPPPQPQLHHVLVIHLCRSQRVVRPLLQRRKYSPHRLVVAVARMQIQERVINQPHHHHPHRPQLHHPQRPHLVRKQSLVVAR